VKTSEKSEKTALTAVVFIIPLTAVGYFANEAGNYPLANLCLLLVLAAASIIIVSIFIGVIAKIWDN
jgi:hypothetical protein